MDWFEKEDLDPSQEQEWYRFWQEAADSRQHHDFTRDAASILAGINQAIDGQEQQAPVPGRQAKDPARPPGPGPWIYKAVAAVVLLAGFLWLFTWYFPAADREAARLVTRKALPGIRERIHLEDGSSITLHAGSEITYQQPFPGNKREITLRGEAFFEVAKDSLRPFIVRTGQLSTRALGTSFNIKYHLAAKDIAVALATGAVQIARQAKAGLYPVVSLAPGQQLLYDQAAKGYRVTPYDPVEVLGWREGILVFKKADLSQVVAQLETWYGVEIEIAGKVSREEKERLYTGAYDNQSLDDVLKGISFVKDFSYVKKGRKMILKFN